LINDIAPWATIAFFAIGAAVAAFTRRTPVPILIGMIVLPIASAISREPLSVTMGFTAMVVIIIVKRLTAQPATEARNIGMGHLLLNRLLFDRDIGDRTAWVHRKHTTKKEETE
jgi:hypothetical protein